MERLNVILLGSGDRLPRLIPTVENLRDAIKQRCEIILEDFDYSQDLTDVKADLAIVFGGDGSMLRASKRIAAPGIPALGVNLGKLGFLSDLNPDQLTPALDHILAGKHQVVDHLMIRCQFFREGKQLHDTVGLNEVAILGGHPFEMQTIELYVNGELATAYDCDGLILSTPIGSTAHNLSAGGPILRKDLQAFIIAPINPHTLTVRPVVDRADRVYEITVSRPNESTSVVLDGQVLTTIQSGDRLRITAADQIFQLIEVPGKNYYRTLRDKLGWAGKIYKTNRI